jgi:phosphate transport system substrate-binding protein
MASHCSSSPPPKYSDTYNTGTIKISADHSFLPLVDYSVAPYSATYPEANLRISATTEDSALRLLCLDSVQLAIASRPLKPTELEAMAKGKATPIYTRIATDAVALIVNNSNPDSLLTTADVERILKGQTKAWSALPAILFNKDDTKQVAQAGKHGTGNIVCVFDNDRSSNLTYMQQQFGIQDQDLKQAQIYATGNNKAVIEYVASHPNALGFVGVGWVFDSTGQNKWIDQVKVVAVAQSKEKAEPLHSYDYYQPYQAYLGDKSYPFRRDINWVYRSGRTGLAMGYAAYMASDKGQRLVLKLGMLPANVPIRMIQMNKE